VIFATSVFFLSAVGGSPYVLPGIATGSEFGIFAPVLCRVFGVGPTRPRKKSPTP
jgi:hypothetical protein